MKEFARLYKAGRVKRYHTTDVPAQLLGQHSWGVAMIVHFIYPNYTPPPYLLMAALVHDLAESETGDIPAPAKWENPELDKSLKGMEEKFNVKMGLRFDLSKREQQILEWADLFELCLYTATHAVMGNEDAEAIHARGIAALNEIGFPTTESKALYEHIFG